MLVLPLSYLQHRDPDTTFLLAKSIFAALPITLLFFVPFLLRDRLSFWAAYGIGITALVVGYFAHGAIAKLLN